MGRGGLLQLLGMSLSPCRHYHPAGVLHRLNQLATQHAAFALRLQARPPGLRTFGATYVFTFVTAQSLADTLSVFFVDGLQVIGFPPPCHPS